MLWRFKRGSKPKNLARKTRHRKPRSRRRGLQMLIHNLRKLKDANRARVNRRRVPRRLHAPSGRKKPLGLPLRELRAQLLEALARHQPRKGVQKQILRQLPEAMSLMRFSRHLALELKPEAKALVADLARNLRAQDLEVRAIRLQ